MKLVTLLVATGLCAGLAQARQTDVLFLGNSYTARNDLPALFEGLSLAGGHAVSTDRNTPGGNTLGAPQSNGAPHGNNATSLALIASRAWDAVVLQDQSFIPTIPSGRADWMIPGAQSLAAAAQASGPGARVVLYQTWGRRDGGQFTWAGRSTPNFADFDAMQSALTAGYGQCALAVGAEVAPVGEAWRRARQQSGALVLHDQDGSHPTLEGSYLAACVLYARVFDESPRGLTYRAGLPALTAAFLQDVADRTVFPVIGLRFCSPALLNSTGAAGVLTALGSESVAADDVELVASSLPAQAFGFFLTSQAQGLVPFPGGSAGVLCLDGSIGRYVGPGQVLGSGAAGTFRLRLALDQTPTPTGTVQVAPGDTWHFQAWHRDVGGSGSTSNFTDGVSVTFH